MTDLSFWENSFQEKRAFLKTVYPSPSVIHHVYGRMTDWNSIYGLKRVWLGWQNDRSSDNGTFNSGSSVNPILFNMYGHL